MQEGGHPFRRFGGRGLQLIALIVPEPPDFLRPVLRREAADVRVEIIPPDPGKVHQRQLPVRERTVHKKGPLDFGIPARPRIVFHLQVVPAGFLRFKGPLNDRFLAREDRNALPAFRLLHENRRVLAVFLLVADGVRRLQHDLLFRPGRHFMFRAVIRIGRNSRIDGISAHLFFIFTYAQAGGSLRGARRQRQQQGQHQSSPLSHLFIPPVHPRTAASLFIPGTEIGQVFPGHNPFI